MEKPVQVLELEKYYNLSLSQIEMSDNILYNGNYNKYKINGNNEIVGLNLNNNEIIDISILKEFTKLEQLVLSSNKISDISALRNLVELTSLNLSDNLIKEITPLYYLIKLEQLDLNSNKIKDINALENLEKLSQLDLSKNLISNIDTLGKLTNLNELNIALNKIYNINALKTLNELVDLDLHDNNISYISTLNSLKQLENLDLSSNKITFITSIKHLTGLRSLDLGYNKVQDIKSITNLTELHSLNLSYNNIFDINQFEFLNKLPLLKIRANDNICFTFDNIQFKNENNNYDEIITYLIEHRERQNFIDENTKNLIRENKEKKATTLDLGYCGITDLSKFPELFECYHLEVLILSNHYAKYEDGWNQIPSKNGFYPNNLSEIPKGIRNLTNLTTLIVGGDWKEGDRWNRWRITNISNIYHLKNLEFLNISNNQISRITDINKLRNLKTLHLNNNRITSISPIDSLINLKELFISNNSLMTVDFLKNSTNLKSVDLHGNRIVDLSPIKDLIEIIGIKDEKWELNTICVHKNPLINPSIEIVRRGTEAVLNLINENIKGDSFINQDIKIILIGNSEAGKTTLGKYLCGDEDFKEKHPYTLWMDEMQTKIKGTNIRFLDFGGHDYYHDTHHIFFGDNTVYLLLWDKNYNNTKNRTVKQTDKNNQTVQNEIYDYPLRYWLDSIRFFVKDKDARNFNFKLNNSSTYNSSVLLIQNKVFTNDDIEFVNSFELRQKYPFIYEFINVDIHSYRNTAYLETLVYEMINKTPITKAIYPKYYMTIKKSLIKYNGEMAMSLIHFRDYCISIIHEDIDLINTEGIAYYLDIIGLILYDQTNKNVYLDKRKLSESITKIFTGLAKLNGEFTDKYLIENAIENYENVVKTMLEFKQIFKLQLNDNEFKYIAPLYLPREPSKLVAILINKNSIPYRRFEYTGFIHKNIILNIFSEYGKQVYVEDLNNNSYYWKNGLIIRDSSNNQIILIKFDIGNDTRNAYIDIINLNDSFKNHSFADSIINKIIEINKQGYGNNDGYDIKEMISLNGVDFIPLELVHKKEEENCQLFNYNDKSYMLADFKNYLKKPIEMKKIFISYAKENKDEVNEFLRKVAPVKLYGNLETWHCSELKLGEKWEETIKEKFFEADIIMYFMSDYFFSTPFIIDQEIKNGIERVNDPNDNVIIVPVVLESMKWNLSPLGEFTANYKGSPLDTYRNRSNFWFDLVCDIELITTDFDPNTALSKLGQDKDRMKRQEDVIAGLR